MTLEEKKAELFTADRIHKAIEGARVSRGPRKGQLKANKPGGDAGAAWLAMTMHANPYKINAGQVFMLTNGERWIFDELTRALQGTSIPGLDRDRDALEALGAW